MGILSTHLMNQLHYKSGRPNSQPTSLSPKTLPQQNSITVDDTSRGTTTKQADIYGQVINLHISTPFRVCFHVSSPMFLNICEESLVSILH